mgnify:CR=1 FL=1
MTLLTNFKAAMLTAATLGLVGASVPAGAVTSHAPIQPMGPRAGALLAQNFGNVAVNAANFLVVAVPGTTVQPYKLVVVEQIKSTPACWSLANASARPTQVNDLWNTFNSWLYRVWVLLTVGVAVGIVGSVATVIVLITR